MKQLFLSSLQKKLIRRFQLQILWLKFLGASIEFGVTFYGKIHVAGDPRKIYIGRKTSINEWVVLNATEKIVIGENCHISSGVKLLTTYLSQDRLEHRQKPIVIGNNCWIAAGVVVGAGVNISPEVTVGANSVVLHDLNEPGLYVGAPAKKVR